MNTKTLGIIVIVIVLAIMAYLLYRVGVEELETRSSAPNPLAEVEVTDFVSPQPSQTITTPQTVFNVSPNFTIEDPIHTRLPMYDFNPSKSFTDEFSNNLIAELGLTKTAERQSPVFGKTIVASKDTRNLTIYAERGEINYTNLGTQNSSSSFGTNPDIEIFKSKAEEFISSLNLENTSFQYKSYGYVVGDSQDVSISDQPREATMIQLMYESTLAGFPVINKSSSLVPNIITVWLYSDGTITKVHYQGTGTIGSSFGNYELLNRDEIRKDLQTANTKAKLVNGDYLIGNSIESINIMRARIAYLSVENYLVPVYILEADVRTAGNYSGTGYLLLEAIKK